MARNSPLPKVLERFVRSGKSTFEDDKGESWQIVFEPAESLPDSIARPNTDAQVFANNGVGDLLFLVPQPDSETSSHKVFVFRHEGHLVEELQERLEQLLNPSRKPSEHPAVYYFDFTDTVQLGDQVELKLWLILRRRGEVVYVPGISPRQPSMERDGLAWVGVQLENRNRVDVIVNPETSCLQRDVRKIKC